MNIIGKFFSLLLSLIFPPRIRRIIIHKFKLTAQALSSNIELRVFWHILFLPITLPLSLIVGLIKAVLIWILPDGLYSDLKYLFNSLLTDISKKHLSLKLSLKRMKIGYELFTKGREKATSFGDKNPDITFFVIRPFYYMETNELITTISNLLYHYYRTLQHLSYAVNNGWVPVIDWENYGPFSHAEDHPVNGTSNCWEYYWNQPSQYSLEEVYQSKNVILSSRNSVDYQLIPPIAFYTPFSKYVDRLIELCPQYDQLIKLNDSTAEYIQKRQSELFPENSVILGVSVRGASYGAKRIPGHPVQPDIDTLIIETKGKMEEWKADYVYFCCEMTEKVEKMKEAFGDKLITLPRMRYEKLPTSDDNPLYVDGQRYQTNLDYLTEMVLLSRCDCLLAGMSGGVRMAIVWNAGKYRKIHIFENNMWMA